MVNTLAWTIGTLALRPDIQETAHAAIVSACGREKAPNLDEENSVPYITALMKESLRQFSTLRLSLPRTSYKDIEYNDLLIPRGTTMFLNVWAANHDESVFGPDVYVFKPERYLNEPEMPHASYGFGTRMCAGFHLANRQLYVLLLMLIWAFKIEPSKEAEEQGWSMRPLEVSGNIAERKVRGQAPLLTMIQDVTEPFHLAAIPPSYKVRFVPRNEAALKGVLGKA